MQLAIDIRKFEGVEKRASLKLVFSVGRCDAGERFFAADAVQAKVGLSRLRADSQ
jgi:hypothetical protein